MDGAPGRAVGFPFAQTGQLSILGRWNRTAKLRCCVGELFKMVRSTSSGWSEINTTVDGALFLRQGASSASPD
jgi:hypothetical protein